MEIYNLGDSVGYTCEFDPVGSDVKTELSNFCDTLTRDMKEELGNFREEVNQKLSEIVMELKDTVDKVEEVEQWGGRL